jgi:hypothetical protein
MVWRMMTLTMSHAPIATNAASDSARLRESPKTTVKAPKPNTHKRPPLKTMLKLFFVS